MEFYRGLNGGKGWTMMWAAVGCCNFNCDYGLLTGLQPDYGLQGCKAEEFGWVMLFDF